MLQRRLPSEAAGLCANAGDEIPVAGLAWVPRLARLHRRMPALWPKYQFKRLSASQRMLCSRHGASENTATIMADAIAWAEARGNRICGLYYLESYCRQLKTGRINRRATPKINVVRLSVLKGLADHGFAQVTFDAAFSQAV